MRAGLVKVLFTTQVAEVGLDFQTVPRVVQWRIPRTLSAAGLWQRWGRACRAPVSIGVGIIFGTPAVKIPDRRDHGLYELQSSPRDSSLGQVLQIIQDFDVGAKRIHNIKAVLPREKLEDTNLGARRPVFQKDLVRQTNNHQNRRTRRSIAAALLGDSESDEDDSDSTDYEDADAGSDGSESDVESVQSPQNGIGMLNVDIPVQYEGDLGDDLGEDLGGGLGEDLGDDLGDQSDVTSETGDNQILEASVYDSNDPSGAEPRRGSGGVPDTCRVMLWIMNTSGCIREYYMRYLDEANFAPTMGEPRSPCCDRCTGFENLDPRLGQMLPDHEASKIMGENSPDNFGTPEALGVPAEHDPDVRGQTQSGKYRVSTDQSAAIVAALRKLRREIWREMGLLDFWSSYTSSQLLSEEHIMTLAKNAAGESGILAGAPLLTALKIGESRGHSLNEFAPPILSAMWAAWLSVPASPPKPRGAPLREGATFVPLFDINPAADPNDQDVIRLHQINLEAQVKFEAEKDRLQAQRGRIHQKREQNSQFPASQGTAASQTASPTIGYDDETLYNKNVLKVIG
jgi:hypothetical protein